MKINDGIIISIALIDESLNNMQGEWEYEKGDVGLRD